MKVLYKNIKILSLLLSLIFLFQSCRVYKSTPTSLDEAVAANKRVKVVTTDNKKHSFQKIERKDSIYYAHAYVKGQRVKVPVRKEEIQSIRPIDIPASTLLTIGAFVAPIGLFLGIFAIATEDY